ncbi:MAG: hypothetical protein AB8G05_08835 [Oligoflexales bacterium]
MKPFFIQVFIHFLVIFLASCSAESSNSDTSMPDHSDWSLSGKEKFMTDLKDLVKSKHSEKQTWVKIKTPKYRKILRKKINKRVLIIDSGMYLTSITLFRDRVIGQYRTEGSRIIKDRYQLTVPDVYHRFATLQSKNMRHYHDDDTQEVLSLVLEKIASFEWAKTAHGDSIFNYIAANTENIDLMILRLNDWECYPRDYSELDNFNQMMEMRTIALQEFFETHQIDYVNFSAGWSIPDFKRTYVDGVHPQCGYLPNESILKQINLSWKKFYDDAFSKGNTILFQAGPQLSLSNTNYSDSLESYLSDCSKQKNRIRVQSLASPVIETNFSLFNSNRDQVAKLLQCSDLLVNTPESLVGYVPNQLKLSPFGLTLYPMGWPSSYTTPMALVAWIKQNLEPDSEQTILEMLIDGKVLKVDIR